MTRRSAKLGVLLLACFVVRGDAGGKSSGKAAGGSHGGGGGGGGGGGDEEIIIPIGQMQLGGGGGGGGGFSIPLNDLLQPGMVMPQGGGGGGGGMPQSMGFEETEEIGPDGKAHIISEKSFNPAGGKMTKAQKANEKAMQKQMKAMAQDVGQMFAAPGGRGGGKREQWQNDLFKNAFKSIEKQNEGMVARPRKAMTGQQQLSNNNWPSGVDPRSDGRVMRDKNGKKIPNGWVMTGNSDIVNNAGITIASCAVVAGAALFAVKYYRTRVEYRPVHEEGIEGTGL